MLRHTDRSQVQKAPDAALDPSPNPVEHQPSSKSFGPGTLSRDALASLVYAGAVRLGTVGLSIVAARRLGSSGAGAIGVGLQVVALATLVATLNLPYGLTQHLSRTVDPDIRARLLQVSGLLIAALTLFAMGALAFAAPILARVAYGDASLAPVLLACVPLCLASAFYLWVEGAMQGLRRFGALARGGVVVAGLDVVLAALAASWGVVAMLLSRTALRLVASTVAAVRWLRAGGDSTTTASQRQETGDCAMRPRAVAASLLGLATPTVAGGSILLLGNTILRAMLVRSHDLSAAGQLQAADSLAQVVTLVPLAAATAFMPAIAAQRGQSDRELASSFRRAIEQVTGYNLALCLTALGMAPWMMETVFGQDFGPARAVFVVLVCAYASLGPSALFGAWLMGHGKPWTILAVNAIWAVAMLLAFHFALSRWGAVGAALASAGAYWLGVGCYALVVAPFHSLPGSSHLPAIAVTLLALGIGASLQLVPGVPLALAVAGNLVLAGLVFARWGAPSIVASGIFGRGTR